MSERPFIMAALTEAQQQARRRKIEDAALGLFLEKGFHGVGLREVAQKARVSLGNIYNHYEGKEPLFTALFERLYLQFATDALSLRALVADGLFPKDLVAVGTTIGALVERHRDYLTLVYVDIAELDGQHVHPHYDDLTGKFTALFAGAVDENQFRKGIDPATAFTAVYLLFTNYFVIERVIQARPFGRKEGPSIAAMAQILSEGLRPRGAA